MQKTLLIVDDEPDIREMLKMDFELEGFTVFEANSAIEALEFLKSNQVQIVISDFRMPQMTGFEMLLKIREKNKSEPKVIIITGFADCTRDQVIEAGGVDMLTKPIDFNKLLSLASI